MFPRRRFSAGVVNAREVSPAVVVVALPAVSVPLVVVAVVLLLPADERRWLGVRVAPPLGLGGNPEAVVGAVAAAGSGSAVSS